MRIYTCRLVQWVFIRLAQAQSNSERIFTIRDINTCSFECTLTTAKWPLDHTIHCSRARACCVDPSGFGPLKWRLGKSESEWSSQDWPVDEVVPWQREQSLKPYSLPTEHLPNSWTGLRNKFRFIMLRTLSWGRLAACFACWTQARHLVLQCLY